MNQPLQTIYAISLEDESVGGVNWYFSKQKRDQALLHGIDGYTTDQLVPFEFQIPEGATHDEITDMADTLMWEGEFLNKDKP